MPDYQIPDSGGLEQSNPQSYNILENSKDNKIQPLDFTVSNQIPYHIPDVLQNIVGPLFRIPHPTISQILLDHVPLYRILNTGIKDVRSEGTTIFDKSDTYKLNPNKIQQDVKKGISKLGTPYMDELLLSVPEDKVNIKTIRNTSNGGYKYIFLEDVLITVTQAKKIITTEIAGNNGTVKEFIGLSDYDITINGRLTGDYNRRPQDQLEDLIQYLNLNITIGMTSNYLYDLGIDDAVITDYDLPQIEGNYSTQFFTINAISDLKPENKFLKHTKDSGPSFPII